MAGPDPVTNDQITHAIDDLFRRADSVQKRRQLVFWYDPKRDFEEVFEHLPLGGVTKLRLDDTPFRVKYRLLVEEPDTSFLLYAPFEPPAPGDNWLLDLQRQAEVFAADRAVVLHRQYGLLERGLQDYLRDHLRFFDSRKRADALDAVGLDFESNEMDLRLAMMCALAGLKMADAGVLLRTLLLGGLTEADNELWQSLTKYFAAAEVWAVAEHALGFCAERPSLRELFIRVAVTHLSQDLTEVLPENLLPKVIRPTTRAYVFADAWLRHRDAAAGWDSLTGEVAADLGVPALAASLPPEAYQDVETFEVFDPALIRAAAAHLVAPQPDLERVAAWLSARKPLHWHGAYEAHYAALEAAVRLLRQLGTLDRRTAPPEALFAAYAEAGFGVDQAYRHYVAASDRADGELLGALTETLERHYLTDYLHPQGETWSQALTALGGVWRLDGFAPQQAFFDRFVRPVLERNDREKVYVIVADALRYEVADELRSSLVSDLRGEAALSPLFGVLPSVTKFGMAALLPGEDLSVAEGQVLRGGLPTAGAGQRQTVLAATGVSATVLNAQDLLAMSKEDGRAAVQPHRLVYIYQRIIDGTGEKPATEHLVFDACRRTVEELNTLVRKIANGLNGTHILVTADHGFLYQRQDISEAEKTRQPKGDVLDSGRRHVLGRGLRETDGSLVFESLGLNDPGLQVAVPKGTLRYALQGAGAQYVHGGSSLQEVCVPVLAYKHTRSVKGGEGPSRKVGVSVSATTRKVTNNHFTVRLVQTDPVGERVLARQVTVLFTDEGGAAVTNAYPLNLDSSAPQATDREYIARLTVAIANPDRNKPYYLVVRDAEDNLDLVREAWQINLAFTDDFGAL